MRRFEDLPEEMRTEEVKKYLKKLEQRKAALVFKRIFDVVVALIMLSVLIVPMGIIGIWIKIDSKGPVFFRQVRITTYGKEFRIFKFRTMVTDAEKLGTQVTVGHDSRITRAGKILRKLRLDELPQLFNILGGSMSFVGTRPEVPRYVKAYTPEMWATLLLPAGVTSETSILYKDEDRLLEASDDPDRTYVEEVLPAKMKYNLEYIEHCGVFYDMGVMFRTILAVLK